jgi:hypothetical protein
MWHSGASVNCRGLAGALLVLVFFPLAVFAATRIEFVPESPQFSSAAEEYRAIWKEDGNRIVKVFKKHTGLTLEPGPIRVIVFEGVSYSGDPERPMQLRASYVKDTKRATLVHELSHRLIAKLVPQDFEDHPITFLFLYDVWVDLWGKEFADAQVKVERARRGIYETAWHDVMALTPRERAQRWTAFVMERHKSPGR